MESTNQNSPQDERGEETRTGKLQLEFKSDRTDLGPGECTDLHLDIFNPSPQPYHWTGDWEMEQEGPSPPLPDGIGGAVNIPPGKSPDFKTIRVCSANMLPGTYRFRITVAPKSNDPLHSNWVILEILP